MICMLRLSFIIAMILVLVLIAIWGFRFVMNRGKSKTENTNKLINDVKESVDKINEKLDKKNTKSKGKE